MIFLLIAREQQEAGYMRFTELSLPGDYGRADCHPHADVPDQDF